MPLSALSTATKETHRVTEARALGGILRDDEVHCILSSVGPFLRSSHPAEARMLCSRDSLTRSSSWGLLISVLCGVTLELGCSASPSTLPLGRAAAYEARPGEEGAARAVR